MKIAIVHDYLYTYGGAERVLEILCEIWPNAPIYTAWADWKWLKSVENQITAVSRFSTKKKIITSWFDKVPFKKQLCSPLRFLLPLIWRDFYSELKKYDVVISSSAWGMSKGVSFARGPIHICYCHTPPRYLYGYPTALNFKKYWWGRLYANLVNPFMRDYDFKSSQAVDWFICNSKEVQKRIWKFYRRRTEIIYPPVFVKRQKIDKKTDSGQNVNNKIRSYFLMVNRLVRPKNVDLAIKTCKKLKVNLKIAGAGPDEKRLKKITGNSSYIEFLGYVDDKRLNQLYVNCKAVLYLAEHEDFGITPLEGMSFGKPVIALRSGGVIESVIEGKTGIFIDELTVNGLAVVLKEFDPQKFKPKDCQKQAEKFSKERFKMEIKRFVEKKYNSNKV